MDGCIDLLGETQMFPTLDANLAYWKIQMDDKDVNEIAFVTHHGLFKYSRIPFELRRALQHSSEQWM